MRGEGSNGGKGTKLGEGKGTKLSEGCPKVRLSQDRMAIFGIFTFGFITLLYGSIRDFYIREDYFRDCFVWEKFVAPLKGLRGNHYF